MCLLVLAWNAHPRYRLVVAANRDEFHARPAAPLARWPEPNAILAGRDLRAQGTWLAVDRDRRFGVITNFRDLQPPRPQAPSRGELILKFLGTTQSPGEFLTALEPRAAGYSGFNLLLTDRDSLWYGSNRAEPFARALPSGVYGLSNGLLDTPWPKLRRVRRRFESWLAAAPEVAGVEQLFEILNDRAPAADHEELPSTGLSPEWERLLSAPFILNPDYGTRCSTVVLIEPSGALYLAERRFDANGQSSGETELRLNPAEWP